MVYFSPPFWGNGFGAKAEFFPHILHIWGTDIVCLFPFCFFTANPILIVNELSVCIYPIKQKFKFQPI